MKRSPRGVGSKIHIFPAEARIGSADSSRLNPVLRELRRRKAHAAVLNWAKHLLDHASDSVLTERTAVELADIVTLTFDVLRSRKGPRCNVIVRGRRIMIHQPDKSFLVRSVRELLRLERIKVGLLFHPTMSAERDPAGKLRKIRSRSRDEDRESFIFVETIGGDLPSSIRDKLVRLMADIETVVSEFDLMHSKLTEAVAELEAATSLAPQDEIREAIEFFRWLGMGNFVLLGYRDYELSRHRGRPSFSIVKGSGLGVLRDEAASRFHRPVPLAKLDAQMRAELTGGPALVITKSDMVTSIYRGGRMDYMTLKKMDGSGNYTGERRFLGFFADGSNYGAKIRVPLLRRKYLQVRDAFRVVENSFDDKMIIRQFAEQQVDTLLLTSPEDLVREFELAMRELEPDEVRVAIRYDRVSRGYAITLVMPQARFRSNMKDEVERLVGPLVNSTNVDTRIIADSSEGGVVRIQFFFATDTQGVRPRTLQPLVLEAVRSWHERLEEALLKLFPEIGGGLFARYGEAFNDAYRVLVAPEIAADDISDLVRMGGRILVRWGHQTPRKNTSYLKILSPDRKLPISDITPTLVNHGFTVQEENAFEIRPRGDGQPEHVFLHVYRLTTPTDRTFAHDDLGKNICRNILLTLQGKVENDSLGALIVEGGLVSREVELLRLLRNYAKQIGAVPTRQGANQTLANHPRAARMCIDAFLAKFDPKSGSMAAFETLKKEFRRYLGSVSSIDDDKILRTLFNVIDAAVRTNYFLSHTGNHYKSGVSPIAIKIDSSKIARMPEPRPWREIYVYGGAAMEGCHLRAGAVARGGLRWSERPDDFRTEVLGLMKTQVPKNAQIVPTGAKGGFFVKNFPSDRGARFEEVKRCYGVFVSAMLDLQDNMKRPADRGRDHIVPPEGVVAYDGNDPYFVVAADKGTATFSDFANEICAHYGYWLGDAFASGGSLGYDHKKEGITARGAWVSVRRHFRELGRDIESAPFTVVGVGDMSGDVFGNGLLASHSIKLVAAFDHRHFFIDPNPDPARSYRERERLFRLPRSSWDDYDRRAISTGGCVYPRSQKLIRLSREAQAALGLGKGDLDPDALMRAILKAPVDLLYNGGIGTYVKASHERNIEVGDPQNDANRIDARELRCAVVCEGGNLGFTQAARVEYALAGGRNYSDAIDNAGGVDLSDHEVNLKILIGARDKISPDARNRFVERYKSAIVADVLRDNYLQTLGVSLDEHRARANPALFMKTIQDWEKRGLVKRSLENLPDNETMEDRVAAGRSFTKPELGVLLAFAKIDVQKRLIEAPIIGTRQMDQYAEKYFPEIVRKDFGRVIPRHGLRNDIVATVLSNIIVNHHGAALLYDLTSDLGLAASRVVEAVLASRKILGADDLAGSLLALDGTLPAADQYRELLRLDTAVRTCAKWLVRNVRDLRSRMAEGLPEYMGLDERFSPVMRKVCTGAIEARFDELVKSYAGSVISRSLAKRLALLEFAPTLLDALKLAERSKIPIVKAGRTIFEVGERLRLAYLINRILAITPSTDWDHSAAANVIADIGRSQRRIAERVLDLGVTIDEHLEKNFRTAKTIQNAIERIETEQPRIFAPYIVVANQIQNLASL